MRIKLALALICICLINKSFGQKIFVYKYRITNIAYFTEVTSLVYNTHAIIADDITLLIKPNDTVVCGDRETIRESLLKTGGAYLIDSTRGNQRERTFQYSYYLFRRNSDQKIAKGDTSIISVLNRENDSLKKNLFNDFAIKDSIAIFSRRLNIALIENSNLKLKLKNLTNAPKSSWLHPDSTQLAFITALAAVLGALGSWNIQKLFKKPMPSRLVSLYFVGTPGAGRSKLINAIKNPKAGPVTPHF